MAKRKPTPEKSIAVNTELPEKVAPSAAPNAPQYKIVGIKHGIYAVGAIPMINTRSLSQRDVNYLVSIGWPYIKVEE